MLEFLRKFFTGEELFPRKKRDVIVLDAFAMGEEEEEQSAGCGSGGCGSCGCH
jgi:hypothetical protein